MKQTIVALLLVFSVITAFAQLKEEAAIKKTIEDETRYYGEKNFEKFSDLWVHSDAAYYSIAQSFNHVEYHGWDAVSDFLRDQMEQFGDPEWKPEKTDYQFRIEGNMAFVFFKENGYPSTRVLEKQDNTWKILALSVVQITDLKMPEVNTDLGSKMTSLPSPLFSMGTLILKAGIDTTEFETFVQTELNPLGEISIPGCIYFVLKADRGAHMAQYRLLLQFESRYLRDLYWPEDIPGGSSLFWALWNASVYKEKFVKMMNYVESLPPEDWTDFVVMK